MKKIIVILHLLVVVSILGSNQYDFDRHENTINMISEYVYEPHREIISISTYFYKNLGRFTGIEDIKNYLSFLEFLEISVVNSKKSSDNFGGIGNYDNALEMTILDLRYTFKEVDLKNKQEDFYKVN